MGSGKGKFVIIIVSLLLYNLPRRNFRKSTYFRGLPLYDFKSVNQQPYTVIACGDGTVSELKIGSDVLAHSRLSRAPEVDNDQKRRLLDSHSQRTTCELA